MMKKIAILGSTGSIGTQTLEVVRYNKDIQAVSYTHLDVYKRQGHHDLPGIQGTDAGGQGGDRTGPGGGD